MGNVKLQINGIYQNKHYNEIKILGYITFNPKELPEEIANEFDNWQCFINYPYRDGYHLALDIENSIKFIFSSDSDTANTLKLIKLCINTYKTFI